MAADFQYITGPAVGIYPPSTVVATPYFGGSPVTKVDDGMCLGTSADVIIGVSQSCRELDMKTITHAFQIFPCIGKLFSKVVDFDFVDDFPYDPEDSGLIVGAPVYAGATGLWTSTPNSNGPLGVVLEAGDAYIVVLFDRVIAGAGSE